MSHIKEYLLVSVCDVTAVLCLFAHQVVIETLSVGATMLLPPLRERMELLHSLLPQGPDRWESLSKGQVPERTTTFPSIQH